ncbi:phosphotransferase [Deinococcus planocerae]|uniref:phosphotransferase n=1 Tax=Deinococcus planocerae TaxID=1737569 RepID=UPI000C7F47E9|nr:phosphotransferase [Deinococcus planocerae]
MTDSARRVDLPTAAALIRADFPELAHLGVTLLGEGTDHLAFDVGGEYVFRFPKRAGAATALLTEARLTAWLAPRLPLALPVDGVVRPPRPDAGVTYAGYARLAGTPALLLETGPTGFAVIGHDLGTFLRRLHDLPAGEARALGVEEDDDPRLEEWSRDASRDLALAVDGGEVSPEVGRRWRDVFAHPPPTGHVAGCLIHGDLAAEHVLLDEGGNVTGVIDWSDAALGDPARDLSGLLHWGGDALLHAALGAYGPVDGPTLERARWFAACRAVADLTFGRESGQGAYVRAGQRALTRLSQPPASR